MKLRLLLLIVAILFSAAAIGSNAAASARQRTTEAYVTLLYGDEFLLGVRVLGKSIRDTGSTKDMVVLVSDGVSGYAMSLLKVSSCFRTLKFTVLPFVKSQKDQSWIS